MDLLTHALLLGTIGLVSGVSGAVVSALVTRSSTSTITSYVQHFAAGLIIAAATLDLVPEALELGGGMPLVVGFVAGTAFMLILRSLLTRFGGGHSHDGKEAHSHGTTGTAVVTGVNLRSVIALTVVVLIDGVIIGITLSAGGGASLLIAIALSIELLFVAASTAGSTRSRTGSVGTAIGVGAFVAVMMPVGTVLGSFVFADVATPLLVGGLAFGAAALLFTAVAELLVEAVHIKESTGTIATMAGGFLLFLILMMLM